MNKQNEISKRSAGLFSVLCGSLLMGVSAIPLEAVAAPVSKTNPCPGIYYEAPYNRLLAAPAGCPSNGAVRQPGVEAIAPNRVIPPGATPLSPPLPEQRSNAIARVNPVDGKVDVKLKNNTNSRVAYEAIGHTQRRFLSAGEEVVLQNLPTPVTITSVREDKGMLDVIPVSTTQSGLLEISLDEDKALDDNLGALRIQRDGQVFLN